MATKKQQPKRSARQAAKSPAKPPAKPVARKPAASAKRTASGAGIPVPEPIPGLTAADRKRALAEEAKWRAESDLRTLQEAEKIRADQSRLANARRHANEQARLLAAVIKPMK